MHMNFRVANIAAAAAGLVLGLGFLIVGGQPTEGEAGVLLICAFLTIGLVIGLLAEREERVHRRR